MATSPRALHTCPKCAKKFGKLTKLERHLLESHGATLSIPPSADPPSPSFLLVETQLESALAEANRRFQLADPTCRLCVVKRPFKNSRDLAQHLVSKHSDALMCAEALPPPCPPSTSEVSANPNPRDKLKPAPAYANKRAIIHQSAVDSDQPPLKRSKTASDQNETLTTHQPSSSANPVSSHLVSRPITTKVPSNPKNASDLPHGVSFDLTTANNANTNTITAPAVVNQAKQTKRKLVSSPERTPATNRTKSNTNANHPSALSSNSSSRSGTPSSGTKPPVTPKRTSAVLPPKESMKRAASPNRANSTQNATAKPSAAVPTPLSFLNPLRNVSRVLSTPLDFSAAGFGANTRKSYYTLKNS